MRKEIATALIFILAISSIVGMTGCAEKTEIAVDNKATIMKAETSEENTTIFSEGLEEGTLGETSTAEVVDGADGKETGTKGTTGTEKVTGTTKAEGSTKATTSKVATGNVEPTREAYTYTKPNRVTATANTTKATTGTKNTTKATTKAVTATTKKASTTATTKAHSHTWLEYYGDLHMMVTKTRTVVVKEAWQEKISDGVEAWQCNECGFVGTPHEVTEHYDIVNTIFAKCTTHGYNSLTKEEKAVYNNKHQNGCSYSTQGEYIYAKYPSHYIEEPVYVDHPAVTKTETYQEEKVQKNVYLGTYCKECNAWQVGTVAATKPQDIADGKDNWNFIHDTSKVTNLHTVPQN